MLEALIMDAATAESLRQQTDGRRHQLNPRSIEAGPFAGQYYLPARLTANPAFADIDFSHCLPAPLDPELAWPAADEILP